MEPSGPLTETCSPIFLAALATADLPWRQLSVPRWSLPDVVNGHSGMKPDFKRAGHRPDMVVNPVNRRPQKAEADLCELVSKNKTTTTKNESRGRHGHSMLPGCCFE